MGGRLATPASLASPVSLLAWTPVAHADAERVLAEAGGGVAGTVGGAFAGGLVGGLVEQAAVRGSSGCGGAPMCLPGGLRWGAMLGAAAGQSAGVALGGHLAGGDGSYWASLGGEVVGLGVATLVTLVVTDHQELTAAVGFSVLPLTGAIVGYELTTSTTSSQSQPSTGQPLVVNLSGWF